MRTSLLRIVAIALAVGGVTGCAITSSDISQEATMCRTASGIYEITLAQVQVVRGSVHTPFDYGNKSVASQVYLVRIPNADAGVWSAEDVQVETAGRAMLTRKGRVEVTSTYIDFHLLVAPAEGVSNPTGDISGRLVGYGTQRMLESRPCAAAR